MKISARNILAGTVSKVTPGAVNAEIKLKLEGGDEIVAIITNASARHLGLKEGVRAYAILKASWLILGKGLDASRLSARNVLHGKIVRVEEGSVNNEVVLQLAGGAELTAIITRESSHALEFKPSDECDVIFKANNVIMAVD